jgi:hypothetical protein
MILIFFLQLFMVVCLVRSSREHLEDALPVFAFFVTLMPLESRLVIPGVFDLNSMRVCLVTLTVLYFVRKGPRTERAIPLKPLMLLHVGWAVCSTLYSLSVMTSVKQLISQVVEYYLLYYLFIRTVTRLQTLYRIVFAMSMAMGVCSICSLPEVYEHWSVLRIFPSNLWMTFNGVPDPLYIEWGRGLRARSTFEHPILFGDALAMTIPLTLYLLSVWEGRKQRVLLWISLGMMVWALYKTSSRGPWIATILCCLLMFLLINNRVRKYLTIVAVLGAIVIVARPGIWDTIEGLYTATTDASSPVGASYLYRDTLNATIKAAVAQDSSRLLLGYGLGTFRELGLEITFLDVTQRWYTCDNNWADFLYETGYVGLFLISILLAGPLWISFQSYRLLPKPENRFSGVLLISLAGFYFLLMSVAGYSWGQQGDMAWILISIVVCHSQLGWQESDQEDVSEETMGEMDQYDLDVA